MAFKTTIFNLLLLRDQVGSRLPSWVMPFARLGWKVGPRTLLRIFVILEQRRACFFFPKNWEFGYRVAMLCETYEAETVSLCRKIVKPGMKVMDVGAHIGYYARIFSRLVGPDGLVWAFEPHPENFTLLQRNVAQLKNVIPVNKAVWNHRGKLKLWVSSKSGGHSLVVRSGVAEIEVQAITLDEFWENVGRPEVHFIKMDIEGAEPQALLGAREMIHNQTELMLVVEFCPGNLRAGGTNPDDFLALLRDLGFSWRVIGPNGTLSADFPNLEGFSYVNLFCMKGVQRMPW
jgi:FkbM family methyltransferase